MDDKLVCDDCGTLNDPHVKACSLCSASLEEERERKALGDPRIIAACAAVLTVAWIGVSVFLLGMGHISDVTSQYGYSDVSIVMFGTVVFLGVFVFALWGAAWRAWKAQ